MYCECLLHYVAPRFLLNNNQQDDYINCLLCFNENPVSDDTYSGLPKVYPTTVCWCVTLVLRLDS